MNSILQDLTIQDVLAVIVSIGVFALIIFKIGVPDQIWSGWMVIITFFFNQPKNGNSIITTPKTGEIK